MQNYGYIHASPPVGWATFGAVAVEKKVLLPERNWLDFKPQYETQVGDGFDTMSCVIYSALNCLEILSKVKYGLQVNRSDRFTASLSGTTKQGNTFWNVATSIKDNDGTVEEASWPKAGSTWEEYMHTPIPEAVLREGEAWLEEYKVSAGYLTPDIDSLWDTLPFSVVQVAIHAYEQPVNGIYPRTAKEANHAVMLCGGKYGEYWLIYDHYNSATDGGVKKLAWNTIFWAALVYDIQRMTPMSPIKVLKKKGANDVGFWVPAISESAFESLAYSFGKEVKKTTTGELNWDSMIEGDFDLR
jgi:hypothetical protein